MSFFLWFLQFFEFRACSYSSRSSLVPACIISRTGFVVGLPVFQGQSLVRISAVAMLLISVRLVEMNLFMY